MNTLMISPMQHISPPAGLPAILFQLHLVSHQAAPTIQLLLGEIIVHIDAVPAKAAAMMKQHMRGLSVPQLETPNSARRAVCLDGLQSSAGHWHCI